MSDSHFEALFEKVLKKSQKVAESNDVFYKLGGDIYFDKIPKLRVLESKDAFLEGSKKARGKKVMKSKKDFYQSCPIFAYWVTKLFFDEMSKKWILEPKKPFF